jgi:hypothetical protein
MRLERLEIVKIAKQPLLGTSSFAGTRKSDFKKGLKQWAVVVEKDKRVIDIY